MEQVRRVEPLNSRPTDPVHEPPSSALLEGHEAAVRALIEGTRWERTKIGSKALFRLLRDPNDTNQVLLLGLSTSRRSFPWTLTRFCISNEGASLLRDRPSIDGRVVEQLRRLPEGTLGAAYVEYLDREGLDPDVFQPTPALPEIPRYISQRVRQSHDLWHVLTGYRTDVPGELALQAFSYAQLGTPASAIVAASGGVRWGVRKPVIFAMIREGLAMGKQAAFLAPVRWELRWDRPLDAVRREFDITPTRFVDTFERPPVPDSTEAHPHN
ncbi:MAG: Coq4 family protein [Myxococcota bacterium]